MASKRKRVKFRLKRRNKDKKRTFHAKFTLTIKRASPQHATTIENLPGDILSEIFIRFLAKQLAKMKFVCKSWNAHLSESSFIKFHLHHSIHNKDKILLFFHWGFPFDYSPFTGRRSSSPNLQMTDFIKLPVNLQREYNVIGSVNGLICFYYKSSLHDYVIGIWNPSLSALLTLPQFSLASLKIGFRFGFGYDPKTDDYKVVKITRLLTPPNMVVYAEVYSMRKGSWKLVSQWFPSHITIRDQNKVCVDGHLHWLCDTVSECKPETIMAFDLSAEILSELPLPDSILNHHGSRSNVLGVLARKLCVMSKVRNGECEVWVMGEYGVAESWVRHHEFSQFSGKITPYGFTSHSEFLFQVDEDNNFAMYDPVSSKTKTFKIMFRNSIVSKVVEYVESLVWIEPANRLQI